MDRWILTGSVNVGSFSKNCTIQYANCREKAQTRDVSSVPLRTARSKRKQNRSGPFHELQSFCPSNEMLFNALQRPPDKVCPVSLCGAKPNRFDTRTCSSVRNGLQTRLSVGDKPGPVWISAAEPSEFKRVAGSWDFP